MTAPWCYRIELACARSVQDWWGPFSAAG
jgi:hypothetical protein